jgi:hypothetical protein
MNPVVTDYTIGFRPSTTTAPPQGVAWLRLELGGPTGGGDYIDLAAPAQFLAWTAALAEPRPVYLIPGTRKGLTTAIDATPWPDPPASLAAVELIRWYQVFWKQAGGWIRLFLARDDMAHVTLSIRKPLEFAAILRVLQSPSPHYYQKNRRVVRGEEATPGYPL